MEQNEQQDNKTLDAVAAEVRTMRNLPSRVKSSVSSMLSDYKVIPNLMATRGSLYLTILGGVMILPVMAAGLTVASFMVVAAGVSLLSAGLFGLARFGGNVLRGIGNAWSRHVLHREPKPKKVKRKKPKKERNFSLWKAIGNTKTWKKISSSKFAKWMSSTLA